MSGEETPPRDSEVRYREALRAIVLMCGGSLMQTTTNRYNERHQVDLAGEAVRLVGHLLRQVGDVERREVVQHQLRRQVVKRTISGASVPRSNVVTRGRR